MTDRYNGLTIEEELDYVLLTQRDPGPVLNSRQIILYSEQEICDRFDWLADNGYLVLMPRYSESHGTSYLRNPTWELTPIGVEKLDRINEKREEE